MPLPLSYIKSLQARRQAALDTQTQATAGVQQIGGAFDSLAKAQKDLAETAAKRELALKEDARQEEELALRKTDSARGAEEFGLRKIADARAATKADLDAAEAKREAAKAFIKSGVTAYGLQPIKPGVNAIGVEQAPELQAEQSAMEARRALLEDPRIKESGFGWQEIAGEQETQRAAKEKADLDAEAKRIGIEKTESDIRNAPIRSAHQQARDRLVELQTEKLLHEMPGGKTRMSPQQIQEITMSRAAIDDVVSLKDIAKDINLGIGFVAEGQLPDLAKSADRKRFETAIGSALQNVGRSLEGGKLAEGDIKRYTAILMNGATSREAFNAVVDQVTRMLSDRQDAYERALEGQEYSVPPSAPGRPSQKRPARSGAEIANDFD